jgi:biopolymer transport protein ExbB
MKRSERIFLTWLMTAFYCVPVLAAEGDSLESAYMKEFAFLESQKSELIKNIKSLKGRFEADTREQNQKIRQLEEKIANTEFQNERLGRQLQASRESIESGKSGIEVLESLFKQAEVTLDDHNVKVAAIEQGETDMRKALGELFSHGTDVLFTLSSLRESSGDFFLENGEKVTGQIFTVGNIASYGVSDNGSGALVPAGDGFFKLNYPQTATIAQNLLAGRVLEDIGIFLYEDDKTSFAEGDEKTVLDIINSGGVIAWIIVGLGALTIVFVVLRVFFLRRAGGDSVKLLPTIEPLVASGKADEAMQQCERSRGAIARILSATLRNLDRDRDHIEDIISESILHENGYFNRYSAVIIVIAGVAPLLGLLGTVTGMISTFDVITQFGTGDPKLLSGGISTALVTTQLGLIVAIPALILGNLLNSWSNRIKDDMEKSALRVINLSERRVFQAAA